MEEKLLDIKETSTKTIAELKDYKFVIEKYQRGYRWGIQEVVDLLEDINEYTDQRNSEDFFAIKFYCTSHKLSKNKYSLHTNTFEVFKIIDSCLQVIPILIAKHPGSSFVAVGSRSIIDDIVEPTANNRRYQLYRQKLIDFFGDREDYLMIMLPDMSGLASIYVGDQTGLSLRRKQQQRKFKISKIKKVVLDCYDDIQNIEI